VAHETHAQGTVKIRNTYKETIFLNLKVCIRRYNKEDDKQFK
jgi:hypothetical protein